MTEILDRSEPLGAPLLADSRSAHAALVERLLGETIESVTVRLDDEVRTYAQMAQWITDKTGVHVSTGTLRDWILRRGGRRVLRYPDGS